MLYLVLSVALDPATQQPLPGASALDSPCARMIDVLLACLAHPGPWRAISGIDIALVLEHVPF